MNDLMLTRRAALQALMADKNLTHILVLTPGMGNVDCWLFADGNLPTPAPFNRNSAFLIPLEGEILRLCQTTTHPTDRAQYVRFEDAGLDAVLSDATVGVVHPETMKKNVRDYLRGACPNVGLVDVTADFEAVKAEKSAAEVELLQKAATEYDRLFAAMPLMLRPERLEKEVVNEIRQRLNWQGAESETPGFHNMVELTSAPDGGVSAQEPMQWPGRRLQVGDRVNVTVRGYIGGVSATLGRSFVLGKPSEEAERYWDLALEAQTLAATLAKPGATLGQITEQVNGFFREKGLPANMSGWIHGLGTSVYEAPRNVDASRDLPLQANMVLSIGPAVQPEGKDAYRCVDAFVVTETGAVRLSATGQTLRQL